MRTIPRAFAFAGVHCLASLAAQAQQAPVTDAAPAPPTAAPTAAIATPTPPPATSVSPVLAGITVSGSLDAYISFNPARDSTNPAPNDLYAFETQANAPSISFAKIAFERKPTPVGFRLDVGFGSTIDIVNATDAMSGTGHDVTRNLEQAYVSWAALPNLTLKVGKMVTHDGFEVIESQSNWNYTHSLLFAWAIPFTETGLALDWVASDKLEASLFIVNGLNNTFEGNAFKSPGLQVIYRPTAALALIQNFSAFNEAPGAEGGLLRFDRAVYLFDTVATYAVSPAVELAANTDVGIDASLPRDKAYAGIAGYARWHTSARTALSGRAEYFHDNASSMLGILLPMVGNVGEGTATFSYVPAAGLLLRGEARLDHAFGAYRPFVGRSGQPFSAAQQVTFTLGAVAAF